MLLLYSYYAIFIITLSIYYKYDRLIEVIILKKSLSTNGNTWQLYISKPIAKLMGITTNDKTVLLTIKNKILTVQLIKNEDLDRVSDLLIKKLIKRSAGYGLNLPLPILELMDVNPEQDLLDIEIQEKDLIIKKSI